jgi:hypothetical protein
MKNLFKKIRYAPHFRGGGLLLGLILAYSLNSCSLFLRGDPEPTELPLMTQEGKNTFGCKINGKLWIPTGAENIMGGKTPPIMTKLQPSCHYTGEDCKTSKKWRFWLLAESGTKFIGDPTKKVAIGIYSDTMYENGTAEDLVRMSASYDGEYQIDYKFPNNLTISKLDTSAKIIAGTFYFTGIDSKGNKITVTDGRFDVKFTR